MRYSVSRCRVHYDGILSLARARSAILPALEQAGGAARVAMLERVENHTGTTQSRARTILWISILLLVGGGSVAILWQALNLLLNGELSWDKTLLPLVAAIALATVGVLLVRSVERLAQRDEG